MKKNKKQLYKVIILLFIFISTKIFVIRPIEEKKKSLEDEKSIISQNMEVAEKYKNQAEEIKKLEENKKSKGLFNGKDDIIEVQNTINKIVDIKSIENSMEIDENGLEVSNISIKFVGTYEDIFKVVDAFNSRGLKKMIKSISISRVSKEIIPDIEEISEKEKPKKSTIIFECTLKISKI